MIKNVLNVILLLLVMLHHNLDMHDKFVVMLPDADHSMLASVDQPHRHLFAFQNFSAQDSQEHDHVLDVHASCYLSYSSELDVILAKHPDGYAYRALWQNHQYSPPVPPPNV